MELLFKHSIPNIIFAIYFKFKSLPAEAQEKALSLWCDLKSNKVQTLKGLFLRRKSSFAPKEEALLVKLAFYSLTEWFW